MRSCPLKVVAIVVALAGTAAAGPMARFGAVGGYDGSAPGNRDDGIAAGLGWRHDWVTAELDYAWLDYDGTDRIGDSLNPIGGNANHFGVLVQARLINRGCPSSYICNHLDLDLGAGERWVHWQPEPVGLGINTPPPTDWHGADYTIGLSINVGWHFAIHYVVFKPDQSSLTTVCRGSCPMQTLSKGDDNAVMFEASFVVGG